MKKHVFFLIALFGLAPVLMADNYDFSETSPSGHILYYYVDTYARVAKHSSYENFTGALEIPDSVEYDGVTYAVKEIVDKSFYGCSSLTSVTLPEGLTKIGYRVFYNCNMLASVTVPDGLKEIDKEAFYGCMSLTSIAIPGGVTSIGDGAFSNCLGLTSVTLPDSLTSIGKEVFTFCASLTSIALPNGLVSIGAEAFSYCGSLTSIAFPEGLTSIGTEAFNFCLKLATIHIKAPVPPSLAQRVFYNTNVDTVYVPCGAAEDYSDAKWGKSYAAQPVVYSESGVDFEIIVQTNNEEMGYAQVILQNGSPVLCVDTTSIITAAPNDGYRFVQWNDGDTNNPRTVKITQDTSFTAFFTPYLYPKLCVVSVQDNYNRIEWNPIEESCAAYRLYRENDTTGEFEQIAEMNAEDSTVYIDTASLPMNRTYRYSISGVDPYGHEGEQSPTHKTMHLTISKNGNGKWNLVWNEYKGAEYTNYIIYRGTSINDLQQIGEMPSGDNTIYTDEQAIEGGVFYQVGAVLSTPCSSTEQDMAAKSATISRSNIAGNSEVGIGTVTESDTRIYVKDGRIVADSISDGLLQVFDIVGRQIENGNLPSGVYVVRIGHGRPHRVVVMR